MVLIGYIKLLDFSFDGGNKKVSKIFLFGKVLEEKLCGWYVFLLVFNGIFFVKGIVVKEFFFLYIGIIVMDDILDEVLDSMRESFEKV